MKCINRTAPYVGVLSAAALFTFAASRTIGDAAERGRNVVSPSSTLCANQSKGRLPTSLSEWAEGAQLFAGLGTFHREMSAGSKEAQAYFDQGMRFLWAFNHDEATRSFAKAAQDDPHCAMCYWGVALTVGPNYNLPMMAEPRAKVAWEALQLALQNAGSATPVEQALISALSSRYPNPWPLDPSNGGSVLLAYSLAMQDVASKFPDDLDIQTLTAEAMMNTKSREYPGD